MPKPTYYTLTIIGEHGELAVLDYGTRKPTREMIREKIAHYGGTSATLNNYDLRTVLLSVAEYR